jgi:predicted flavoprotein YhiN
MMCAAVAGRRGRRVLLIEHYDKLGEKIRISGGGRCNFTNLHAEPANYLSQNPDFCRSALSRYTPRDFIELVERYRIAWHEKTLGQLFCDRTSLDIIALLKTECDASACSGACRARCKGSRMKAVALRCRPRWDRLTAKRWS